jgi:hypothetical protein
MRKASHIQCLPISPAIPVPADRLHHTALETRDRIRQICTQTDQHKCSYRNWNRASASHAVPLRVARPAILCPIDNRCVYTTAPHNRSLIGPADIHILATKIRQQDVSCIGSMFIRLQSNSFQTRDVTPLSLTPFAFDVPPLREPSGKLLR